MAVFEYSFHERFPITDRVRPLLKYAVVSDNACDYYSGEFDCVYGMFIRRECKVNVIAHSPAEYMIFSVSELNAFEMYCLQTFAKLNGLIWEVEDFSTIKIEINEAKISDERKAFRRLRVWFQVSQARENGYTTGSTGRRKKAYITITKFRTCEGDLNISEWKRQAFELLKEYKMVHYYKAYKLYWADNFSWQQSTDDSTHALESTLSRVFERMHWGDRFELFHNVYLPKVDPLDQDLDIDSEIAFKIKWDGSDLLKYLKKKEKRYFEKLKQEQEKKPVDVVYDPNDPDALLEAMINKAEGERGASNASELLKAFLNDTA